MTRNVEVEKSHFGVRPDWLAQLTEPVLDPSRRIVDPHHHLWTRPESFYGPDDLAADIGESGHNIVATVLVEGHAHYRPDGEPLLRPVGEVENAMRAAAAGRALGHPGICAGIVAYADLSAGDRVAVVLDAMQDVTGESLKGIRFNTVSHPDPSARGSMFNFPPGMLLTPDVRTGLTHLVDRGLSFDGWMYHTQLGDLEAIARDFPDLQIVLNHLGGPLHIGPYRTRQAEVFDFWRVSLESLAVFPNISIKLGGFGMKFFGFEFHTRDVPPDSDTFAAAIRPYTDVCLSLFGADRCMFESNFPVDKASVSAKTLWNAYKKVSASCSEAEKEQLFSLTAERCYRL